MNRIRLHQACAGRGLPAVEVVRGRSAVAPLAGAARGHGPWCGAGDGPVARRSAGDGGDGEGEGLPTVRSQERWTVTIGTAPNTIDGIAMPIN